MPATSPHGFPYPSATDADNVPADMLKLCNRLEVVVTELETRVAKLPRAMASGRVTETGAGTQTTWVSFPSGRFSKAPDVTVTVLSGAGAHTWDTPRIGTIGNTGFQLVSKNGQNCVFTWIAVEF